MKYTVRIDRDAERPVRNLPRSEQERLLRAADALAGNPRPPGVRKMRGFEDQYRIRVGDYRVIYQIYDDVLLVQVVQVGNRRGVY